MMHQVKPLPRVEMSTLKTCTYYTSQSWRHVPQLYLRGFVVATLGRTAACMISIRDLRLHPTNSHNHGHIAPDLSRASQERSGAAKPTIHQAAWATAPCMTHVCWLPTAGQRFLVFISRAQITLVPQCCHCQVCLILAKHPDHAHEELALPHVSNPCDYPPEPIRT